MYPFNIKASRVDLDDRVLAIETALDSIENYEHLGYMLMNIGFNDQIMEIRWDSISFKSSLCL
ncbi:MAG: hypothetical protein C5S45_08975 [Candidatus Methanocomedens sp.]|jgi:hypothetical protein|nr:MAG: hypothetical protein C5S45_08975 [ANME-2 cluster archaeon]